MTASRLQGRQTSPTARPLYIIRCNIIFWRRQKKMHGKQKIIWFFLGGTKKKLYLCSRKQLKPDAPTGSPNGASQMKTTPPAPITAEQTARAMAHAAALLTAYIIQTAAAAARAAYRLARMAWQWLNARHDFDPCHEEPVILTGWQYIGLSLVVSMVLIALSIDIH